jgi:Bromodomain
VDFSVPVTLPEYRAVIKAPIVFNDIRDKRKAGWYTYAERYVEDMRPLARNTANFNKGEDLAWANHHARLLLEAAEGAVASGRADFHAAEIFPRLADAAAAEALAAAANTHPGKRKRTADANGVAPAPAATTGTVSTLAAALDSPSSCTTSKSGTSPV